MFDVAAMIFSNPDCVRLAEGRRWGFLAGWSVTRAEGAIAAGLAVKAAHLAMEPSPTLEERELLEPVIAELDELEDGNDLAATARHHLEAWRRIDAMLKEQRRLTILAVTAAKASMYHAADGPRRS
jgi:hypothetical protein